MRIRKIARLGGCLGNPNYSNDHVQDTNQCSFLGHDGGVRYPRG